HGQMAELLGLWVKGLDVDWHRLYGAQTPRRLDLPTYPYASRRFWLPGVWDRGGAPKPQATHPLPPPPATPAVQQPVPVPVTSPPRHEEETAEGSTKRAGPKVQLVPPARVADTGETVIHPKPRGIVLPPLTVASPIDAAPTVPLPHVALTPVTAPELVP